MFSRDLLYQLYPRPRRPMDVMRPSLLNSGWPCLITCPFKPRLRGVVKRGIDDQPRVFHFLKKRVGLNHMKDYVSSTSTRIEEEAKLVTCLIATRSSMKSPCHKVVGIESRGDDSMGNHKIEVDVWLCLSRGPCKSEIGLSTTLCPLPLCFLRSGMALKFEARFSAANPCCRPASLEKIGVRTSPNYD